MTITKSTRGCLPGGTRITHHVCDRQNQFSLTLLHSLWLRAAPTPLKTTETAAEAWRANNKRYRGDSGPAAAIFTKGLVQLCPLYTMAEVITFNSVAEALTKERAAVKANFFLENPDEDERKYTRQFNSN